MVILKEKCKESNWNLASLVGRIYLKYIWKTPILFYIIFFLFFFKIPLKLENYFEIFLMKNVFTFNPLCLDTETQFLITRRLFHGLLLLLFNIHLLFSILAAHGMKTHAIWFMKVMADTDFLLTDRLCNGHLWFFFFFSISFFTFILFCKDFFFPHLVHAILVNEEKAIFRLEFSASPQKIISRGCVGKVELFAAIQGHGLFFSQMLQKRAHKINYVSFFGSQGCMPSPQSDIAPK